ncbi:hypothetical protein E8E13_005947 [Curvularia kusanoi]|uniref:Uncharacterized protein n=1 Tax=Curvularia kusanoi TaxID=90978 RepID=A0A9P4TPB1_CURKU|nr:hypothetical protein E8E13_005947 [Curvularia kusanoi]
MNLALPDGTRIGHNTSGLPTHISDISGMNTIWKWNHFMYGGTYSRWNGSFLSAFSGASTDVFTSSIFNVSIVTFTDKGCEPGIEGGESSQTCSNHTFDDQSWITNLNAVATSCTFYPCVRDYHGSVQNTRFTETVIAETPILQPPGQDQNTFPNFVHFHTPCIIDGQAYTVSNASSIPKEKHNFWRGFVGSEQIDFPTQCLFGIYGVYALSLGDFMSDILDGNCTMPGVGNFRGRPDDYSSIMCDPWALKGLAQKGDATFPSIDANMQSIALAITSEIRKQGSDWDSFQTGNGSESLPPLYAKGTVLRTTVCTKFDWKWLAFPLALVVLTMLLLCITCGKMFLDKRRIPAWKSSILPLLFTGDRIGSTVNAGDLDQIITDSDKIIVKLSHDGKGWEFVSAYNPQQENGK